MEPSGLQVHLGCGGVRYEGFLGVDIVAGPEVDIVTDLQGIWPWEDSSVDRVIAEDVFEHLPSKLHTLRELWRVLKHDAVVTMQVPDAAEGGGAFGDPTHVSYWTLESFADIYMLPSPYHPGGFSFLADVVPTPFADIKVGRHIAYRRWVRGTLTAVKP